MLLAILASQLAAPQPIHSEKWFSSDDYPYSQSWGLESDFRTITQTLIDAHGKIIGCRIETPSSNPKVDALACAIILKRGSFEPAHWTDGTPVAGVYRTPIAFIMMGDSLTPIGDIELDVASLPGGKSSPEMVSVEFAVSSDGRIVACQGEEPATKRSRPTNPALVQLACQVVTNEWKPFTVFGEDGKPSRSVQNAKVLFRPPSR